MQFHDRDCGGQAAVGRPLTFLNCYSPALMLHTMHAPELLPPVDLFHHQHETGEDFAHTDMPKLAASDSPATLVDCLPYATACLLAYTARPRVVLRTLK